MSHPLQQFLDDYVSQIEPLVLARHAAYWRFTTQGDATAQADYARLSTQLRQLHADSSRYQQLQTLVAHPAGDPLLDRQGQLALNNFQGEQMPPEMIEQIVALETEIEAEFNSFRAQIDGQSYTDNELKEILRISLNSAERQAAWEASKQIGRQVADRVLRAVQLRNQAAHTIGFDNYYTMSLHLQELDEAELFALFERLEAVTRPLFSAYKNGLDQQLADRFHVPIDQLRPWHYADPFFQDTPARPDLDLDRYYADREVVELTREFYRNIGLPIDAILERSDLYERPGKQQHAYCLDFDRKGDTRVLGNVKPNAAWMGTLLHEYGHAVYGQYHDPALPFLLRTYAHTSSTEAIAMLMGRLYSDGVWLQRYLGLPRDEVAAFEPQLRAHRAADLLIFTRWDLVVCHFERELYRHPEQDLNTLWWDLVEEFQQVKRPDGRHAPDWAAKIHIACYPAYYHNYMLGEMTASQLQEYIHRQVLKGDAARFVDSPQVGQFLREKFFKLGARYDWNRALEAATGETLNPEYFAKHLA